MLSPLSSPECPAMIVSLACGLPLAGCSWRAGFPRLRAADPVYPDIALRDGQTVGIWGVVGSRIQRFAV